MSVHAREGKGLGGGRRWFDLIVIIAGGSKINKSALLVSTATRL